MRLSADAQTAARWIALAAILVSAGCASVIPETDDTAPGVELRISGEGIGPETMTNPPRERWTAPGGTPYLDLMPDTEYAFTLTVTDAGGAARATVAFPGDIEVIEVAPEATADNVGPLITRLTLLGSRDDPRTALVVSGRLKTPRLAPGQRTSFTFDVEATDFGGKRGRDPNRTSMTIDASIAAR